MKFSASDELYKDPFYFLDEGLTSKSSTIEFPNREIYLTCPEDAKRVLANKEDQYLEHSDFFITRLGSFMDRQRQIEISKNSIIFLSEFSTRQAKFLPILIERHLLGNTSWPNTGNQLFYQFFKTALLSNKTSTPLKKILDKVVTRAVYSGAKFNHSNFSRLIFRLSYNRKMKREINRRRRASTKQTSLDDLLDIIIRACDKSVPPSEISELFLSLIFATVGSVGFALGWSLYCLGNEKQTKVKTGLPVCSEVKREWIVKEALRLWPVAWNLARKPKHSHELVSCKIQQENMVVACPYTTQRNPKYWPNAHEFKPERWAEKSLKDNFLAFGWGEHKCIAANFSVSLVAQVLTLLESYQLRFEISSARPKPDAALAPPPFTLTLISV